MKLSRPIPVLKRHARLLSRELKIPLHAALDRLARQEGFRSWSHLSATVSTPVSARSLLGELSPGDLVLLAARPRQGKTLLSLQLILEALKSGRAAAFFTLEFTGRDVMAHMGIAGPDAGALGNRLTVDTSDAISADYIVHRMAEAERGTLVVIDYLQLLDQRRSNPDLQSQVTLIRDFTRERELITICLSQIRREFEQNGSILPSFADLKLPNPLDLRMFTQAVFLHQGRSRVVRAA